jgi:lipopolysaccharide export system permease protein
MKTYIKFLLNLFFNSFWKIFLIFFGIIFIINVIEQIEFFKNVDINFMFPIFLSFLNTPSILFELLPFIFLISTQVFFIRLIDNHELEIFKYSGLNNIKILKILTLISFIFGLFFIIFFYNVASLLKGDYLEFKNKYSNDNKYLAVITKNGLWMKDIVKDKTNIINANNVSDNFLTDVLIAQFDKNFTLTQTIQSKKIDISSNQWKIFSPTISKENNSIIIDELIFKSNFDLKKINSLFSNLSSLTVIDLLRLKKSYQSLNYSLIEIDSHIYKIISYPFYLTLITILISIIMFSIGYRKNTLFKIVIGIFLSVIIYYINNFFNVLGTSEKIPLLLSIWFPLFILLTINITFILRLNEK